jgi:hypothetical protein
MTALSPFFDDSECQWNTIEYATKASALVQRMAAEADSTGPHSPREPNDGFFLGPERSRVTLKDYIRRLIKYSQCPMECHMAAVGLIQRLDTLGRKDLLVSRAMHRVYLAALVISTKMTSDVFDTMNFYAVAGGIHVKEMVLLEQRLLIALDFHIHVTASDYDEACQSVFGVATLTNEESFTSMT